MVIIKRLDSMELIEDACELLYMVHIKENPWGFSPDNPAKLRVKIKRNRSLLVDRFTESAVWFGAFYNTQLVGCTRLTFTDENNKFEVEGYGNSSIIQTYLPLDKGHCVESSRTAVLQSNNGYGISRWLLLAVFKYCEDNKYSVLGTSHHGYIVRLFEKIGFPLKKEYAFKYEENDPLKANFYFADYAKSEIKNMILNLEEDIKNSTHNKTKTEASI